MNPKLFLNKILSNYLSLFKYNFKKECKINFLNQSGNGNFIHIDFPKLSRNTTNFPNFKGPDPIPKKGCESPDMGRGFCPD